MRELIRRYGKDLSESDIDHLHMLVGDWQVLSDIGSADLILWIPDDRGRFVALAHARPGSGFTITWMMWWGCRLLRNVPGC